MIGSPNLRHSFRIHQPSPRNDDPRGFSVPEQRALVAFLEAPTDDAFVTDQRFSDPFR